MFLLAFGPVSLYECMGRDFPLADRYYPPLSFYFHPFRIISLSFAIVHCGRGFGSPRCTMCKVQQSIEPGAFQGFRRIKRNTNSTWWSFLVPVKGCTSPSRCFPVVVSYKYMLSTGSRVPMSHNTPTFWILLIPALPSPAPPPAPIYATGVFGSSISHGSKFFKVLPE